MNYSFLTQKERDNETGLDYFLARYYSSTQGRFTSPDEFSGGPDELYYFVDDASDNPTFYADLRKPQSLNKYQYAYNNPLRWVDPDGHDPEEPEPQDPKPVVPVPVPIGPGLPVPITISPSTPGPTDQQIIEGAKSVLDTVAHYTGIEALADWLRPKIMPSPAPTTTQPATGAPPSQQSQPLPPPPPSQQAKVNKVKPAPGASGPHSVAKRDPRTGKVTGYTEYDAKGNPVKRFRPDGKPHGGVKPPLVVEPKKPGGRPNRARPAKPEEIP